MQTISSTGKASSDSVLAHRLRKRARYLDHWAVREKLTAYRVFDRDIPGYHFTVDRYADWLLVSEYPWGDREESVHAARRGELEKLLPEILGVPSSRTCWCTRKPHRWGQTQYAGGGAGQRLFVKEGDLRFEVNLGAHLDSGLFLDHRRTRSRLRSLAAGRRLLNLFCYTGAFTVYAAAGGASGTTSVDLSASYLAWARRNLELNRLAVASQRFERTDVLAFLLAARGQRERYDLIVCDPPSFSTSAAMSRGFEVQRDHVSLLANCRALLAPQGKVIFSTNFRSFRLDPRAAEGMSLTEWTPSSLPPDFSAATLPHRCWLMES